MNNSKFVAIDLLVKVPDGSYPIDVLDSVTAALSNNKLIGIVKLREKHMKTTTLIVKLTHPENYSVEDALKDVEYTLGCFNDTNNFYITVELKDENS